MKLCFGVFFVVFVFFFLHCEACVILVPDQGSNLGLAVKVLSPNH